MKANSVPMLTRSPSVSKSTNPDSTATATPVMAVMT